MSVKFLGQFLLQRGAITPTELHGALDLMARSTPSLSTLAVRASYLTLEEAAELDAEVAATGAPLTELLAESPRLTAAQLDELLHAQTREGLALGAALVQLGVLGAVPLREHLDAFAADQSAYRTAPVALPAGLNGNRAASTIVALFPQLVHQGTGLRVALGESALTAGAVPFPHRASVVTRGAYPLRVELAASDGLTQAIADALLRPQPEPRAPDVLVESLGELLNVVVGNAVAVLETAGVHLSLLPPDYGVVSRGGLVLDLSSPRGDGALVLDPDPVLTRQELELP